jgi:hypothetical protein
MVKLMLKGLAGMLKLWTEAPSHLISEGKPGAKSLPWMLMVMPGGPLFGTSEML